MIRNVASAISLQRHHEPRRIRRYAGGARYHSPVELRGEQQLARRKDSWTLDADSFGLWAAIQDVLDRCAASQGGGK